MNVNAHLSDNANCVFHYLGEVGRFDQVTSQLDFPNYHSVTSRIQKLRS
jgi:hypothetical protein